MSIHWAKSSGVGDNKLSVYYDQFALPRGGELLEEFYISAGYRMAADRGAIAAGFNYANTIGRLFTPSQIDSNDPDGMGFKQGHRMKMACPKRRLGLEWQDGH